MEINLLPTYDVRQSLLIVHLITIFLPLSQKNIRFLFPGIGWQVLMEYVSLDQALGMCSHNNINNYVSFRVQGNKQNSHEAFQVEYHLIQELSAFTIKKGLEVQKSGGTPGFQLHRVEP